MHGGTPWAPPVQQLVNSTHLDIRPHTWPTWPERGMFLRNYDHLFKTGIIRSQNKIYFSVECYAVRHAQIATGPPVHRPAGTGLTTHACTGTKHTHRHAEHTWPLCQHLLRSCALSHDIRAHHTETLSRRRWDAQKCPHLLSISPQLRASPSPLSAPQTWQKLGPHPPQELWRAEL